MSARRFASVLLTAIALAQPALAQAGAEPPPFTLAPAGPAAPAAPAPVTAAEPNLLTLLPAGPDTLTLTGETATRQLPILVQPGQAEVGGTLVLAVDSTVSDDPQASRLAVSVNGQSLGAIALGSGPQSARLALPPGLLQPGYNALTLTADQVHRVDCSVAATYELWTRIDPAQSGFAYASATASPDWTSLLAMVGADAGYTDIRARLAPNAPLADRNRMLGAVQALAVAANIGQPRVDFAATAGTGNGIDLIVDTPDRAAAALAADGAPSTLHPGVNVVRNGRTGQLALVVADASPDALDRDIAGLAGTATVQTGTPQGLAANAVARGLSFDSDRRISLAALGLDSRTFHGRHFGQTLNFSMPRDFYPADYAKAGLHLSAFYAPGLAHGAQLLVRMNGQTVATVLLNGSRTGEIRDQMLPIPLSAFRPGRNSLDIEADLPAPADAACNPGHVSDNAGRLQLSGNSYLELSDFAEVGRFPDLATLDSNIGGKSDGTPVTLMLAHDDAATLDAGATLLAKLAVARGRPIDARLQAGGDVDPNAATLLVGAFADLPQSAVSLLNLNLVGSLATPPSPTTRDVNPLTSAAPATGLPAADSGGPLQSIGEHFSNAYRRVRAALRSLGGSFGIDMQAFGLGGSANFVTASTTSLLLAQRPNASGTAPLTLIAASNARSLPASIDMLVSNPVWDGLGGSTMTLAADGKVVQSVPALNARLFFTRSPSLWNGRLIVAGWLSNNAEIYALLCLVAALLLGLSTALLLRTGRRRTK